MRRKIIVFLVVSDKRTRLGNRIDAHMAYSLKEMESIYKKVSRCAEEKFISLFTDLEGYETKVYTKHDAMRVLYICSRYMAHVQAIDKCCEKYNGLEDDIDEMLIEDAPFENIDAYLRETVDDSLYNHMDPKYVPKRTYIGEVLQDCLNECRVIVIKDLHENKIAYCKNFYIKDISYLEEYKEKLHVIMNTGLDIFLMTQELVVEEKNKHCWQKVYFF